MNLKMMGVLCGWLGLPCGCMNDLVEGQRDSAGDDDDGTTTEPEGITINPTVTASASGATTEPGTSAGTTDGDPTTEPPTTGESEDASTTESVEPTTGDPSKGSSSDDATTEAPPDPGFLDCLNGDPKATCSGTESCIYDIAAGPSVGVCAGMNCADVSECPDAPPGGDALPVCVDVAVPAGNECILDCSGGETCPTDMICFRDELCMWAQHGMPAEDFEGGEIPASWTLHDVDGNTPNSMVSFIDEAWVAAMTGGGDWVAVSTSWYSPSGTANDWLVTPAIAVSDGSTLEFEARAPDMNFPDGYEVRISTAGPDVADLMANPALLTVAGEDDVFTVHTIDLAAEGYADQTVWIAWRNTSTDKYLLQVDDIQVTY